MVLNKIKSVVYVIIDKSVSITALIIKGIKKGTIFLISENFLPVRSDFIATSILTWFRNRFTELKNAELN